MEKQTEDLMKEFAQRILDGLDQTTEFAKEQIPDVLNQLLLYHFWHSLLVTLFGMVIIVGAVLVSKKLLTKPQPVKEDTYPPSLLYDRHGYIQPTIIPLVVVDIIVVSFSLAAINLTWLKIWLAPKVYILEYVRSMV